MILGNPNVDRLTRRRDETRREILDAAWAVVRQSGWSGLTQRAVAERVGMRAPSLYSHFASKMAIVDAMFGEAWREFVETTAALWKELPTDPRTALQVAGMTAFDAFAADPEKYVLMNQRAVPGFVPSAEAYEPARSTLERLRSLLSRVGIDDPDAAGLWTALMTGHVNQQIANDPGGDRWRRLLPRAIDMFADEFGLIPRRNP
jgi:AcrR family transcriptional regulator